MQGGEDREDVWDGQSVDNVFTRSLASNWFNLLLYIPSMQGGEDREDVWDGQRQPWDDQGLGVHHHHQRLLQPHDGGSYQRKKLSEKSKYLFQVFGPEKGVGARSAVGLATLPHNCPVEVECVFQIKK